MKTSREVKALHIPSDIIKAPKKGFSSPDASWFKGESIDFVKAKLFDPKAALYDVLEYGAVEKLINEHLHGDKNRRLLIWALLSVQTYLEQDAL